MHEYRHAFFKGTTQLFLVLSLTLALGSCSVYTINKADLESTLKPKQQIMESHKKGLNVLTAMHCKMYNNAMDTVQCADALGQVKTKHFHYDSKITVVTNKNRSIRFYAKTLYIWNEQYLIGERASIKVYGSDYCLVKLSDISRIEVKRPGTRYKKAQAARLKTALPVAER